MMNVDPWNRCTDYQIIVATNVTDQIVMCCGHYAPRHGRGAGASTSTNEFNERHNKTITEHSALMSIQGYDIGLALQYIQLLTVGTKILNENKSRIFIVVKVKNTC